MTNTTTVLKFEDVIVEALTCDIHKERAKALAKEAGAGISGHLFRLAQEVCKGKEDSIGATADFMSRCDEAELWYKGAQGYAACVKALKAEKLEGIEIPKTVPRSWTQAKSNIKSGMEAGLNPAKFETESAFRKAKIEKSKAKQGKAKVDMKGVPADVYELLQQVATLAASNADVPAIVSAIRKGLTSTKSQAAKVAAQVMAKAKAVPPKQGKATKADMQDKGQASAVTL